MVDKQSGTSGGGATNYRAFISYSHRDLDAAKKLHARLEGYAIPRRLVGEAGRFGTVPKRLTPVFRDLDDLPAALSLSDTVRGALARAETLIVLCSPDAAASKWVTREIEYFRELHPDRPILPAILRGEPDEAFPAILRSGGVEPLAADLREGHDGWKLGRLKLVAGMLGIGLDTLVQRDAQRQVRRVMAVTAAALVAMLIMAALTITAIQARRDADRQRAEAEGLVEFMLTDLRSKLEGVGRLDILTTVNRRALAHYAHQELDNLSVDELERRARILHAMGQDDELRGDYDRALSQFQEARRTTQALLEDDPDDPQRIFNQSQSEYWVAFMDWRQNRYPQAQAGFERYAQMARKLVAIDPDNPDWLAEQAYAEGNLGAAELRIDGKAAEAERSYASVIKLWRQVAKRKPGDAEIQRNLSDAHAWLADAQRMQGKLDEAFANRQREATILRGLQADDPKNAVYTRDLQGNALGLAKIELDQGKAAAAQERLSAAYQAVKQQSAADGKDEKVAKQKIATGLFLAKSMILQGQGRSSRVQSLFADCASPVAQGDEEITTFCAILQKAASQPVAGFSPLARSGGGRRLSLRWGIDFDEERKVFGL